MFVQVFLSNVPGIYNKASSGGAQSPCWFYSSSGKEQSPGVQSENEAVLNGENENQLDSEIWLGGLGKHCENYKKNMKCLSSKKEVLENEIYTLNQ